MGRLREALEADVPPPRLATAGAEVMKPLATPVLGGMVSSLLHVLVVTPVIFYWLRARELPPLADAEPAARIPWRPGRLSLLGATGRSCGAASTSASRSTRSTACS